MRRISWVMMAAFAVCASTRAQAQNLREFLQAVEAEATLAAPLRADGTIEIVNGSGNKREPIALVLRPPGDVYIELHDSGTRALLLDAGARAVQVTKGSTQAEEFKPTATLADSDFAREDLQLFRVARFADSRISDDGGGEVTVILFPTASQYTLLATTFERDKKVPIKTIYYRDTLNNAVKMRRDGGYVLVGRKWLPTTITMESFRLKTKTTLTLHWTQDPPVSPELFDPAFLARPSSLTWPAESAR